MATRKRVPHNTGNRPNTSAPRVNTAGIVGGVATVSPITPNVDVAAANVVRCPHPVMHAVTDDQRAAVELMRKQADAEGLFVLADFMTDRLAPCEVVNAVDDNGGVE
jgi:hypothetical protein